jgi:hypothetical protein
MLTTLEHQLPQSLAGRSLRSRSTSLLSRLLDGAQQLLLGSLGLSELMPLQVSWFVRPGL